MSRKVKTYITSVSIYGENRVYVELARDYCRLKGISLTQLVNEALKYYVDNVVLKELDSLKNIR